MEDHVILVNEKDEMVGVGEKIKTHRDGLLHRAFSIFIFNSRGELLLQRRALTKYHSAGLWSNTCCGHPRHVEQVVAAAQLRLEAEMGLSSPLEEIGSFVYRTEFDNGLIEHEYDHVLVGHSDKQPTVNLAEVIDWTWMSFAVLQRELRDHPEYFTFWLRVILDSQILSLGGRILDRTSGGITPRRVRDLQRSKG
jgi:isopentenyl-diphosphate Delta-isomerase